MWQPTKERRRDTVFTHTHPWVKSLDELKLRTKLTLSRLMLVPKGVIT